MLKGNNGVAKGFLYTHYAYLLQFCVCLHIHLQKHTPRNIFQGELIHHSVYDKALCLLCFGGVSTFDKVSTIWFMITVFASTFS